MKKITKDKHNVTIDNVKNLYSAISEPIMVFNSNAVPNAYVILTDLKDGAGDSVIAAMHLSRKQNRIVVNRIASVYGKENVNKFVIKQISKGNLKYADNKKVNNGLRAEGSNCPSWFKTLLTK